MKKFKLIGCIVALVSIVWFNVYTVMGNTVNSIELQIEDVEYVAEGDGNFGFWGWLGLGGIILETIHQTCFTGLEWIHQGKETDKQSVWYGQDKYRCESAFFGTAECNLTAILYGVPPVNW